MGLEPPVNSIIDTISCELKALLVRKLADFLFKLTLFQDYRHNWNPFSNTVLRYIWTNRCVSIFIGDLILMKNGNNLKCPLKEDWIILIMSIYNYIDSKMVWQIYIYWYGKVSVVYFKSSMYNIPYYDATYIYHNFLNDHQYFSIYLF